MIKTFLLSFLLLGLCVLAGDSNVFAIITHKATFYVALGVLVVVLIAAVVVLRKYGSKRMKDEEDGK